MAETDGGQAAYAAAPAGHGHVVPMKVLAAVFGMLVLLTLVTVAAADVDLGRFNLYAALAIAALKASLVALYFYAPPL